jgi:chromosome segregation ATPase
MAMAGLGDAASVIAVIDLSAKVASLCFQYSREVASAKKEIVSLQEELGGLQDVLAKLKHLLEQPNAKLSSLPEIRRSLNNSEDQLKELDKGLDIKTSRKTLSRLGLRALKLPFESKEVEKITNRLGRYKQSINLAFQIDQT